MRMAKPRWRPTSEVLRVVPNGELPQSIMSACAQGIGSEGLASKSHTKRWTKETAFQPILTCFAARQLTWSLAYATKILICQLWKR